MLLTTSSTTKTSKMADRLLSHFSPNTILFDKRGTKTTETMISKTTCGVEKTISSSMVMVCLSSFNSHEKMSLFKLSTGWPPPPVGLWMDQMCAVHRWSCLQSWLTSCSGSIDSLNPFSASSNLVPSWNTSWTKQWNSPVFLYISCTQVCCFFLLFI